MKSIEISLNNKKKRETTFRRKSVYATQTDKRPRVKKIFMYTLGILFLTVLVTGVAFGGKIMSVLHKSNIKINPIRIITRSFNEEVPQLKKGSDDRTNGLLVGIDTRPSDPGLKNTDTIIAASLNHKTKEVAMISIPRDFFVENPRAPGYYTKINAIYNICESNQKDDGMKCLSEVVEEITGLEIHYYGMIDTGGMIKVIDTLGGIEVDVERAFIDYMFPLHDYSGVMTVNFDKGLQHMDGETAMIFARSRYSQSTEGSDFARARRQQRVIIATRNKLMEKENFLNLSKIWGILDSLGDSVKTSGVTDEDILASIDLIKKIDRENIFSLVLDPIAGNWSLVHEDSSISGYQITPKAGLGNWTDVRHFVQQYISNPGLYSENARIYVYDGGIGYYEAYAVYQELTDKYPYLNITFGGTPWILNLEGIQIVTFSESPKFNTLNRLNDHFDTKWEKDAPEFVSNIYAEDIVILIGKPAPEESIP